jgi:hypothetical protein
MVGGRAQTGVLDAVLSLLRGLLAELAPTERVLWEIMGSKDRNFDGALTRSEVEAALDELLSHAQALEEREAAEGDVDASTQMELAELRQLRAECRQQSVEELFVGGRRSVTLADVIRWWWDMSEEFRIASGFVLPAEYLQRSVQRQPEEMFRLPLRRAASETQVAEVTLRGHARVFAELRALAVRRAIEGLHSRTPTRTTTSVTSEVSEEDLHEIEDHNRDGNS